MAKIQIKNGFITSSAQITVSSSLVRFSDNISAKSITGSFSGSIPALSSYFKQGGNSFGTTATLGTNDASALAFETNGSTRMTLDTNGNLGIGTSSPNAKLNIYTGGTGGIIINTGASTTSAYVRLVNAAQNWDLNTQTNNRFAIYDQTFAKQPFTIEPNTPDNTVWLNASGNVGIGTNNPLDKLSVSGSLGFYSKGNTRIYNAVNATDTISLEGAGGLTFKTYSAGFNTAMVITTAGNVGIGTTSTAYTLQVGTGANSATARAAFLGGYTVFENSAGTGNPSITFNNDTDTGILNPASNTIVFTTSGSEKVRIDSSGNVGIGTSSPGYKLDVNGLTASSNGFLSKGAFSGMSGLSGALIDYDSGNTRIISNTAAGNSTISFLIGNSSAFSNAMVINSTGNVGIGTTNTVGKLDLVGNFIINGASNSNIAQQVFTRSDVSWGIFNETDLRFYSSNSNTTSPSTLRMAITSNGHVGIGTSNTFSGLQIQTEGTNTTSGSFLFVRSTNASFGGGAIGVGYQYAAAVGNNFTPFRIRAGTTNAIFTVNSSGVVYAGDTTGAVIYGNHDPYYAFNQDTNTGMDWATSDTLTFKTGGTERLRINSSGYVGIGTSSPGSYLQVGGYMQLHSNSTYLGQIGFNRNVLNGTILDGAKPAYQVQNESGTLAFQVYNGSGTAVNSYALVISSSANIGIGTSNPSGLFHIYNSTSYNTILETTTANNVQLRFRKSGTDKWSIYVGNSSNDLTFWDGTSDRVTFQNGGNVGIGTTSPAAKLDVTSATDTFSLINATNTAQGNRAALFMAARNVNGNVGNVSIEAISVNNQQNDMVFRTGATTMGGFGTERIRITSTGNIGINTADPDGTTLRIIPFSTDAVQRVLHIGYAGSMSTGINGSYISFGNGNPSSNQLARIASYYEGATYQGSLRFYTNSNTDGANPTERMRIDYGGNVGIGTTSPAYKLDVSGTGRVGDVFLITTATTSDARLEIGSGRSGNGNSYLDLIGDATYTDYGLRLIRYDSGANSNSRLEHRGTGQLQLFTTEASALVISTNSSERVRIDSSGNVGIGTSSPVNKLDVRGNVGIGVGNGSSPAYVFEGTNPSALNHNLNIYGQSSGTNDQVTFTLNRGGGAYGLFSVNFLSTNRFSVAGGSLQDSGNIILNPVSNVYIQSGNLGVGTASPSTKLDVVGSTRLGLNLASTHAITGSLNIGGSTYNNSIAIDKFEYFSLQPYIEGGSFPSNVFSLSGTFPTFVTMTGSACPFGKVAYNVSYYEAIGDYIPVQAGETLYGEIWAYRSAGATGTAGVFYCGIARYDKDKRPIDGNAGLNYFIVSAATVPSNSTWTKYSNTTTLPLTHTPYAGSDGGPVRYVRPYIIVNYTAGTVPTYWAAFKIRKQQLTRDAGAITISGSVGIGTTNPTQKLDIISGSMRVASDARTSEIYFGTLDAANIYLKRDNNYDLTLAQHASSGNSLYLAGAGSVYVSIDSNNNETTAAFIVQNNSIKSGTELFRVNEAGNVGIGSSSPSAKLDVVDTGNFFVTRDANAYPRFTVTNGSAQLGLFRTGTSSGGFYIGGDASLFSVWDSSFSRLVNINTSGNIGINVASPLTKLDIANTQANGITMRYDTTTNYQAWIRPYWNSSTDTRIDFAINRTSGATPDVIMSVGYGGNVGIGTTAPAYKLEVSGSFAATTKSFIINHPTQEGKKLVYGSLESPYHGIRLTGRDTLVNGKCKVELPDYMYKLVRAESVNIQLTGIKCGKTLFIDEINVPENSFTVAYDKALFESYKDYEFFWDFTATRSDVPELITEL